MSDTKRIIAQPTFKAERNQQIYKDHIAGMRNEELAVKYGLSFQRVYMLLKQQKRLNESKEVKE